MLPNTSQPVSAGSLDRTPTLALASFQSAGGTAVAQRTKNPSKGSDIQSESLAQRVAFVTLGQTPRNDVVPDLRRLVGSPIETREFGVLDGVSAKVMSKVGPGPGDPALLTRLRDGSDMVLSLDWTSDRMREIYGEIARQDIDLVVLMSTMLGDMPAPARATIFCDRVAARAIETFAHAGQIVGIVLSLESQGDYIVGGHPWSDMTRVAVARPGDRVALEAAIDEFDGCDIVVLHSVTYSEPERKIAQARSGKPVVIARRLVASAIRDALDHLAAPRAPGARSGPLSDRLRLLSVREREIMFLVAEGLANKEIAFRLGISFRTVEIHRARMMSKMDFRTMTDLVRTVDSLSGF